MRLISILLFCITWFYSSAQITPDQMVVKMGRGINLGNVLSAPNEGNWAPAVEESYFQEVASVGFKTVRVPIRFDTHTTALNSVNYEDTNGNYIGSALDYAVDVAYLDRIEEVMDWALNQGLVVIIDVHGDRWYWDSFDSESSEYKTGNDRLATEDRFRAIWRDISSRFQNKSEDLIFEIMNEAYFSMSAAEVDTVNTDILSIIRQTNFTRNVIVNGGDLNSWEAPLQMSTTFLNSDSYLIATFHYYKPFSFTSSSNPQYTDTNWGSNSDKNTVDSHFDAVLNWSQNNGIPVFLGEFGADNEGGYNYVTETYGVDGGPDNISRVAYYEYLSEAAVSRGFAFTAWDAGDKSNKTIYKVTDRSWVVDVRNAILGIDCLTSMIIKNADIECGYDDIWGLLVQNGAVANSTNAEDVNSRSISTTMKIEVTNSANSFNSVILRNDIIEDVTLSGRSLKFVGYAKASSTSQQFKMRIKTETNGVVQLTTSQSFNIANTDFERFEFEYQVPLNTTSLQFQVLCGKQGGDYYFDDFNVEEQETLSTNVVQNSLRISMYPNPANYVLNLKSNITIESILIYNLKGQQFELSYKNSKINVSDLSNGFYIFKVIDNEGNNSNHKILINHKI